MRINFVLTVAGDVNDFDEDACKTALAAFLSLAESIISLRVASASVAVHVTITIDASQASAVVGTIEAADAAAYSGALGVTVEAVSAVTTHAGPPPRPPSDAPAVAPADAAAAPRLPPVSAPAAGGTPADAIESQQQRSEGFLLTILPVLLGCLAVAAIVLCAVARRRCKPRPFGSFTVLGESPLPEVTCSDQAPTSCGLESPTLSSPHRAAGAELSAGPALGRKRKPMVRHLVVETGGACAGSAAAAGPTAKEAHATERAAAPQRGQCSAGRARLSCTPHLVSSPL